MNAPHDPFALSTLVGADGSTFQENSGRLADFYRESEAIPPVANCYKAWSDSRSLGLDNTADAFVSETCLSLVCRIAAYRFLELHPSERDLWTIACGDYFVGSGLGNFLGEDFFSWPFFRRSMGIGNDTVPMEAMRSLFSALEGFDFVSPSSDLVPSLYRACLYKNTEAGPSSPPDATNSLNSDPTLTGIAADCGDGAHLASFVSAAIAGRASHGEHAMDSLMAVPGQFLGMTSDPLAAVVASVAFLFALSETVKEPHPPILIPVYLADANRIPKQLSAPDGGRSYVIDAAGDIVLPEQVATDPLYLDWLLGRFPNYQRGAALRLRAQPEKVAVQEVLNAWYNYLTSPKSRTPIPEPLTPAAADLMVEAAKTLILAYVKGSGPPPLHLARNAPAPLFAARRKFDFFI